MGILYTIRSNVSTAKFFNATDLQPDGILFLNQEPLLARFYNYSC